MRGGGRRSHQIEVVAVGYGSTTASNTGRAALEGLRMKQAKRMTEFMGQRSDSQTVVDKDARHNLRAVHFVTGETASVLRKDVDITAVNRNINARRDSRVIRILSDGVDIAGCATQRERKPTKGIGHQRGLVVRVFVENVAGGSQRAVCLGYGIGLCRFVLEVDQKYQNFLRSEGVCQRGNGGRWR